MGAVTIARNGYIQELEDQRDKAIKERDEYKESAAYVSALTRENAWQRKEMHKAQDALARLIKLHEREVETGQPISGEDWEIAGYALGDSHKHS
jgi:hypothetical protein